MHQPIVGSVEAIDLLRQAGHRVLFVTNNSYSVVADQVAALRSIGIEAQGDVCTSSQAAGRLLNVGDRVLLGGGPGAVEAIESAGAILVGRSDSDESFRDTEIDVVMVGYHSTFDYRGLSRMSQAVRDGARLIATNDDATYPTPRGLIPGGGSIVAAVAVASGVDPIIAGKPHAPMANLVREMLAMTDLSSAWMVGDRPSTDGEFAHTLQCNFAQVLTGISTDDGTSGGDTNIYADLAAFAKKILQS